jgi:lysophospholipase L1-like esterase
MKLKTLLTRHGVLLFLILLAVGVNAQTPPNDCSPATTAEERAKHGWLHLWMYCADDVRLGRPSVDENRIVFFGDSITQGWNLNDSFPGRPYINRGISGETTTQMLVRFRQDVIDLAPKAVNILAGTNDIAGNTGPITLKAIEDNFASMTEIAQANGVRVILASVLPVYDYPWHKGLQPVDKIATLNSWLKNYALAHGLVYLDYYSAMQDDRHGLPPNLSRDGVHPNKDGYAVMAPLAEKAITKALHKRMRRPKAEHSN